MNKSLVMIGLVHLITACNFDSTRIESSADRIKTTVENANKPGFEHFYENSPSKATLHTLKTQSDFCSDKNRRIERRGKEDILESPDLILRDLTVDAICADGLISGNDGHVLALDTALVAETYDIEFEYQNLLYSLIATSHKSSYAQKAWAYDIIYKNKMELVNNAKRQSPGGAMLKSRERHLYESHSDLSGKD